ncbi:polymeric immunoglobulin receptor-like isoform X2 [Salminus brasiliensis]|uniref:polymeric immunoglobulin receptor-like isoform X2 n=1 Tax=Salminus brasiliensis TaxID=930266 RepID=UPI003B836D5B
MGFYSLSSSLILLVFLLFISDSESVRTLKKLAVRRGGSLSVPCFYDKQYKLNHKYWCKGYYWSSCGIVAYTDQSTKTTSVTDHPTQNMFTVELNSLQDSDSGYYWCAVEIGGFGTPDDGNYVDLMVSADPAVRVENSSVSGQEGGSVSVQCFYSAGYKNKLKKWCRFTDWSCYPNSAVNISDDGKGSFRVEMSGLQKSDAGWYWFSAGDVGVTVHLTITNTSEAEISTSDATPLLNGTTLAFFIILGLFLLLVVGLVIWTLQRHMLATKRRSNRGPADVLYSNIVFRGKSQTQPDQEDHDDKVIYNAVKCHQ